MHIYFLKGTITVANMEATNNGNNKVIFKNCAQLLIV